MKKTAVILLLLCCWLAMHAQVSFKTIVPMQPVIAGESFQVQFTISNAEKVSWFKAPYFEFFRFISGPDLYSGKEEGINGSQPVKNYVFTLEAVRPGHFIIHGATALLDGKLYGSNQVIIEVISKKDAINRDMGRDNSAYLLLTGENPYNKIRQNLFLKVEVNKKNCYTGEPVLATFKLYSRLQSKSAIVKSPGFYGFTVYDMVNLDDKEMSTENVNGKFFDVHTIRKVQLFPLQSGIFTIDAMEVKNRVEFSRSSVNKKKEEKIAEDVLNNYGDEPTYENTEVFETSMKTEPVLIAVKPVPSINKPGEYNGAAGFFNISSSLSKTKIAKNEEIFFDVVISGKGNFTQLSPPVINWPDGVEGFEPVIRDSFEKSIFPLTGSRTYQYGFVCPKTGKYQLPQVNFSFFNPSSGSYKMISSAPVDLEVGNKEKTNIITDKKKASINEKNAKASKTAAIIIVSILTGVLIYWIRYKMEPMKTQTENKINLPSVEELLTPAQRVVIADDKDFYTALHQCIWNFLKLHFILTGSDMNKKKLADVLLSRQIKEDDVSGIISALEKSEAGMFTNAALQENKEALLQQVKLVLERISGQLF
ncbi:MAG TPA: BatD family protein [Chitinophagaceae bacterium]|nr:BatD family protein [Chitinophagaceae bacterium]